MVDIDYRYEPAKHAYECGNAPDHKLWFLEHVQAQALYDSLAISLFIIDWQARNVSEAKHGRDYVYSGVKIKRLR